MRTFNREKLTGYTVMIEKETAAMVRDGCKICKSVGHFSVSSHRVAGPLCCATVSAW